MELTISFEGKAIDTMVYIKMDAEDHLLLSEGVYSQLGVVTYHPKAKVSGETGRVPSFVAQVEVEDSHCLCGPLLLEPAQELEKNH